ncbi:DEAD/DEAH box helicase [Paraliomyxa miuraensis]|uniref:DEAD/DEAH box helicase n=1 Tax=Paraliomyxa miuraensis TaxID=376150 RepID=UPI002B1CAA03|nr:DEAD/DEAH box helicase [Paraliomyxa miuraensis]
MDEFLRAIRQACSPRTWSRGVELARSGAVVGVDDRGDEVELRVTMGSGVVSPLVSLYPDEHEWDCECNGREDACMHVAAGAIAIKQLREHGEQAPTASARAAAPMAVTPAMVAYRLFSHERSLALRRVIAREGEPDRPIRGSLKQAAQGLPCPLVTTEADLAFEKRFGTVGGGLIAADQVPDVLHALSKVEQLTLDGDPVTIGPKSAGLCVRIWDVGNELQVQLEQDPAIEKTFKNGALLRSGKLAPLSGHGLSEPHFRRLRKGWVFESDERGTLAGDLLPRWRRRLPVIVETDRLPQARTLRPRLHLATARMGDELEVLATVVYGDPPVARVDGDRLTLLSQGEGEAAPIRNFGLEKEVLRQLRALELEPGVRRRLSASEAVTWRSRAERLEDQAPTGAGFGWEGGAHRAFFEVGVLQPRVRMDEGSLDVWFQAADEGGRPRGEGRGTARADATAVLRAWDEGAELVPLLDGGFGRVPVAWLSEHGPRVLAILRAKEQRDDELPPWALPDVAALCEALEQPPPPAFEQLRALVEGLDGKGLPPATLPDDLRATLRDYQADGVRWLSFLRRAGLGGILADDMGLGKTLQALCAVEGRTLVVAPTSVLPNWAAEARRFRPSLRVCTYHGPGRALDPKAELTLTTYALLRLDLDALAEVEWHTVVLDEAQAIKNPDSQVARAAFRMPGRFRVAMTGTPVENRLEDLWSQMQFANPGLLGGRSEFHERYVKPIAAGDDAAAASRAALLRQRIRPFLLRRRKQAVARELPPRTDVVLHCELSKPERELYDAVRAATQDDVARRLGAGDNMLAVLEALLRLRQAACHPALVPGHRAPTDATVEESTSSKLALLRETLEECVAEEHKALVFSQWTSLLDLCEPVLEDAGLPYVRLDGSTRDRGAVVERFQDEAGPPVMLISLRAGGTGLNLTAADHVFLLDPWWNPAVEDQAADRAHRIGQDKPVLVHRLVARDTVEERILALQEHKRAVAESAVGGGGGASAITREELLALLE